MGNLANSVTDHIVTKFGQECKCICGVARDRVHIRYHRRKRPTISGETRNKFDDFLDSIEEYMLTDDVSSIMTLIEENYDEFKSKISNYYFENGDTLVHYSVRNGFGKLLYYLLQKGFDPNIQTRETLDTGLHLGTINNELNILSILIKFNADPKVKNANNQTPYDIASETNNWDAIFMFDQTFKIYLPKMTDKNGKIMNNGNGLAPLVSDESVTTPKNASPTLTSPIKRQKFISISPLFSATASTPKTVYTPSNLSPSLVMLSAYEEYSVKDHLLGTPKYSTSPSVVRHRTLDICALKQLLKDEDMLVDELNKIKNNNSNNNNNIDTIGDDDTEIIVKAPPKQRYRVAVSDYGMTRILNEEVYAQTYASIGPLKWMAPESISDFTFSFKSDVYSFGITMWEVLTGRDPYPDIDPVNTAVEVLVKQRRPPISDFIPPRIKKLMRKSWHKDPNSRPTFERIVQELRKYISESNSKTHKQ